MQIADMPVRFEKHYYLKGLKKELCQLVKSNKDNLVDMMTLKMACLRQDNITDSNTSNNNKKQNSDNTNETAWQHPPSQKSRKTNQRRRKAPEMYQHQIYLKLSAMFVRSLVTMPGDAQR